MAARLNLAESRRGSRKKTPPSLLRSPKFLFQLPKIHFYDRRPAMRTGVGHGATAQVFDQVLQFAARERVVGFDGVTADGLGNGVLAQTRGVKVLTRGV